MRTVTLKVEAVRLSRMPLLESWIHSGRLVLNGLYSNKKACIAGSSSVELITGCRIDGEKPF